MKPRKGGVFRYSIEFQNREEMKNLLARLSVPRTRLQDIFAQRIEQGHPIGSILRDGIEAHWWTEDVHDKFRGMLYDEIVNIEQEIERKIENLQREREVRLAQDYVNSFN